MGLLKAVPGSVLWLRKGTVLFRPICSGGARCGDGRGTVGLCAARPLAEHLAGIVWPTCFWTPSRQCPYHRQRRSVGGLPGADARRGDVCFPCGRELASHVGLPELVTTSLEDYQALALRSGEADAVWLGQLRARLEANRKTSPLFDGGQFARNLEKAYRPCGRSIGRPAAAGIRRERNLIFIYETWRERRMQSTMANATCLRASLSTLSSAQGAAPLPQRQDLLSRHWSILQRRNPDRGNCALVLPQTVQDLCQPGQIRLVAQKGDRGNFLLSNSSFGW